MISKEIKNLLINLFSELINCERSVEINRQVLSESADFDAHQIFNFLLSTETENITVIDIIKYLQKNGIEISEQEAKLIILFYDMNSDGKLSFEEFLNFSRSDKSSLNNKLFRLQDNNISFNINYSLCKLFQKEILASKRILNILKEIQNKNDFNLHNIYHVLKSNTYITSESLKNFLSSNNIEFMESDIKFLMRRLDLNKDGKINLCEFHALICFNNCNYSCLKKKCDKCLTSYCQQCYKENHGCNSKKEILINNKENKNPNLDKKDINIDEKSGENSKKENTIEIKELNDYIKFLIKGENKIENLKIELAKINDFNIEDIFRIFEKNGRGYLDKDDIKYGLSVFNIYPGEYNFELFFKRYDLQKKGFLSYEDFFDILVPFEKEYRLDVQKRLPKSNCPQVNLNKELNNKLSDLFKFLIDFENKANIEKKSLNIDLKGMFNELDSEKQGYFNYNNFIDYLNEYNLIEENMNPDLLYIRLDKNRNGIIDLEEFTEEMMPL